MDHPLPWLRYVDAGDLKDDSEFDGMRVDSHAGDKLGSVDGFIVDSDSGRPYYVVVDAGGWFKSKHFLLPVGHARINANGDYDALIADVPRDRIERFPGFDKGQFEQMKPADIKRLNDEICAACSVTTVAYAADEPYTAAWQRPDYSYPDWWSSEPSLPSRMGDEAFRAGVSYTPSEAERGYSSERTTARERAESEAEREGRDADPSPYFDGRAQPGDVIGLETGGEQTHVGETREDENRRRREAEKDASKLRD